jgi:hypothetical protein
MDRLLSGNLVYPGVTAYNLGVDGAAHLEELLLQASVVLTRSHILISSHSSVS